MHAQADALLLKWTKSLNHIDSMTQTNDLNQADTSQLQSNWTDSSNQIAILNRVIWLICTICLFNMSSGLTSSTAIFQNISSREMLRFSSFPVWATWFYLMQMNKPNQTNNLLSKPQMIFCTIAMVWDSITWHTFSCFLQMQLSMFPLHILAPFLKTKYCWVRLKVHLVKLGG